MVGKLPKGGYEGELDIDHIFYVKWDASGTNNGTSWADAFIDFQDALIRATYGDTIYVARGTYKPTITTNRDISFMVLSGVTVFGHCAGTESNPNERQLSNPAYETILSGDIDNNGIVDTIFYSEGDSTELTNSVNPKDRPLYRERNGGNKNLITTITDFRVTYYDSTGNELTYLQLNNQNFRDKIKTLKIYFRFESADPIDGFYNAAEWLRIIRPRNI